MQLSPFGKLPCLKILKIYNMYGIKYLNDDDDDESHDVMGVKVFPSLNKLQLEKLPN